MGFQHFNDIHIYAYIHTYSNVIYTHVYKYSLGQELWLFVEVMLTTR